jgi:hypothetical protein
VTVVCGWLAAVAANEAGATPSSTYWTPCTIDIQPAAVTHLGLDNYWSGTSGSGPSFPTDIGPEWGAKLGPKLAAEYGFDVVVPSDHPWFFNAKIGYREKTLSPNAPALQLGFFNFGTASGETNQNVAYLLTGKSLPDGKTRVAAAYYVGNGSVLRSSTGEEQNTGFMVALSQLVREAWCWPRTARAEERDRRQGQDLLLSRKASLLVGPVWFNDRGVNGG